MRRHLYLMAGFVSIGLGAIGAFLPLLPTVPFMILAAFCFARSSPRLEAKLLDHRQFGPHIRRWREHGAISRRGKVAALAAFGFMHDLTEEPLLKKMLRYIMSDEARHVAFGVLSLQEVYQDMTLAEIQHRQEFAFEAALRMRDRFLQQEVWEYMGVDSRVMCERLLNAPEETKVFQRMLFSKIVPNCRKLGLLDAGAGWLREKFTEIGVIEFEHMPDTGDEFLEYDLQEENFEEKAQSMHEAAAATAMGNAEA